MFKTTFTSWTTRCCCSSVSPSSPGRQVSMRCESQDQSMRLKQLERCTAQLCEIWWSVQGEQLPHFQHAAGSWLSFCMVCNAHFHGRSPIWESGSWPRADTRWACWETTCWTRKTTELFSDMVRLRQLPLVPSEFRHEHWPTCHLAVTPLLWSSDGAIPTGVH